MHVTLSTLSSWWVGIFPHWNGMLSRELQCLIIGSVIVFAIMPVLLSPSRCWCVVPPMYPGFIYTCQLGQCNMPSYFADRTNATMDWDLSWIIIFISLVMNGLLVGGIIAIRISRHPDDGVML